MASKNRRETPQNQTRNQNHTPDNPISEPEFFIEGDRLTRFLQSIRKQIESHRNSDKSLPEKLWLKRQFAVGVNEVTRILERMPASPESRNVSGMKLQAVLIASDCNPRWLTKHLPNLAASRNVSMIFVKDNKEGSLRLGEIVKTAIALGIKHKGSCINEFIQKIIDGNGEGLMESVELGTD
ncbi:LOW QUALITY PROTEIN: hypothetical protein Cgig2_005585 [Carnegiea gigantea]|uniref:Ribosomal protein eL8/eL30/eS12/Gadd45 domain-containing protein n=1 Tax=Carnegiea gigantea TaxID=171969 RepID=A0A9Q1QNS7_9CARY|nr:LOW QUALITY PROTEIN: hypothetical protein Cgig2_005585 [Carnegiea gigantea]